ncbi:MAG TPA: FkbM family methyltransferase, partial [Candidatus Bathyarchaeia archaeon]|nr:FkbM family methyltransferase [Candidatus Bathyarchaeia archaeon]
AYRKYFEVIRKDLRNQYPFEATLLSKERILLNSRDKTALFALLAVNKDIQYDITNDMALIKYSSTKSQEKQIKLYGITQNLDAILVFGKDGTYDNLPMNRKTVVDIGACTADTSIFFTLHGANQVIAVEPYPKNFEMAKKNVKENNLENKIEVILGACGSTQSSITVDPNYSSSMRSSLVKSKDGISIPVVTLEQILEKCDSDNPVLKMDCEGCEYEVILSASQNILRKFSHIQIEYHSGYRNLKKKLENSGFSVSKILSDNALRGHISAIRHDI